MIDSARGGHRMDFDPIADDPHCRLEGVATLFLLACVATPAFTFLCYRHGKLSRRAGGPDGR